MRCGLIDALGGAERIMKTPVPFAYAHHIKLFVLIFCLTVPFAMSSTMHWLTPVGAALLAFGLLGIDEIGVEIEEPFGYDPNDLPLESDLHRPRAGHDRDPAAGASRDARPSLNRDFAAV